MNYDNLSGMGKVRAGMRASRCAQLALPALLALAGCSLSPATPPCFDPGQGAPRALLADGKVWLDISEGIVAIARQGPPMDFVVYDFMRGDRQIGGVYFGNAPGLFALPEGIPEREEEINGHQASTRQGRSAAGEMRESIVELSVVSEKTQSGQRLVRTNGWPGFAHFWYGNATSHDARAMDAIIASTMMTCVAR